MCAAGLNYVELKNGGRLAYEEEGDPDGAPVLFCHGWPASRLQGAGFGVEARELGLRILAPDRPGIGLSTPQPGRSLLDWPPLVTEMMDQLEIDRFCILGVSGGGPYTLATAWAMGPRVQAAVVVSGAPPLGPDVEPDALFPIYRWLLQVYRLRPGLLRRAFWLARPFLTLKPPRWAWPYILRCTAPSDAQALSSGEVLEGSFACYREAWRNSAMGVVDDAEVYAHPWGFPVEEIQCPVRIWHGRADRSFHWRLAERLAERLPSAELRLMEHEGHYSLPIQHRRAILEDLQNAAGMRHHEPPVRVDGQSLPRSV